MKSRLLASALATVLAPAVPVAALAAGLSPASARAADVEDASCQVHAVLASKEGEVGIPKELQAFEAQLSEDEFAIYKSFYLIEQKALDIHLAKRSEVKFRSGNRIGLSLLGSEEKRLTIHADLSSRDGTKSVLSAKLSLMDGAVVMLRAGTYEHDGHSGKLFFAIQCARSG